MSTTVKEAEHMQCRAPGVASIYLDTNKAPHFIWPRCNPTDCVHWVRLPVMTGSETKGKCGLNHG